MSLNASFIKNKSYSNRNLERICVNLLRDQGFSELEAKEIMEVEVYILSPKDTREISNKVRFDNYPLEQAKSQLMKAKQRRYFLLLLQQFWDAQARKYKEKHEKFLVFDNEDK